VEIENDVEDDTDSVGLAQRLSTGPASKTLQLLLSPWQEKERSKILRVLCPMWRVETSKQPSGKTILRLGNKLDAVANVKAAVCVAAEQHIDNDHHDQYHTVHVLECGPDARTAEKKNSYFSFPKN
jgi:hypothetical protein